MKNTILQLLLIGVCILCSASSAQILVEDEFNGDLGSPPDSSKFDWFGDVVQNGTGQLSLHTMSVNQSWVKSRAGVSVGSEQVLTLQFSANAYAEGGDPGQIYGDGQPRGLRAGTDDGNVVEFYSVSRTTAGLRVRQNGQEAQATFALSSGVDSMHHYKISVTTTSVSFFVDGLFVGTLTDNIPTEPLNFYVSTFDGYAGNVPVTFDNVQLSVEQSSPEANIAAWGGSTYTAIPDGLSNVVTLAAGVSHYSSHCLAVCADGPVFAWGDNGYGQASVPAGLSNVTGVAVGEYHSLAVRANGTVSAWGRNNYGQLNVPAGLSNVVAVASGGSHNLALRADGTVAAWGLNWEGQCNVPSGLSNVVAIAAGGYYYASHSVALCADGTVHAWGFNMHGQSSVPAGLSNVTAIAAGALHNLALKSDGTVVAWGYNSYGQTTVPAGLSNVVSVAAGNYHSLAVQSDGTVVAWGDNSYGQVNVPGDLAPVSTVAGGLYYTLALIGAGAPHVLPEVNRIAAVWGSPVFLHVRPTGHLPMHIRWMKDGNPLVSATNRLLELTQMNASDAGGYCYVVSNAHGVATGTVVNLTMMEDGDIDGLPDLWEVQYFGGITNFAAESICSNGINTVMQAYVAGFSPVDSSSDFSIMHYTDGPQSILHWNAVSGRVYSIYWTTNLLEEFQALETNITADVYTDAVHRAGQNFYRISVQKP